MTISGFMEKYISKKSISVAIILLAVIVIVKVAGADSLGGSMTIGEALDEGGIWYEVSGTAPLTENSEVRSVMYFHDGKVNYYDMDEIGGSILADYAGKTDKEVMDSVIKERRDRLSKYSAEVEARLKAEKAASEGEINDITIDLTKLDQQQLEALTRALVSASPYDSGLRSYVDEYYEGDISKPITRKLVIQRDKDFWKEHLADSIRSDEYLLDIMKTDVTALPYELSRPNGTEYEKLTFETRVIDDSAAADAMQYINDASDMSELIPEVAQYISSNLDNYRFSSYDGDSIIIKEHVTADAKTPGDSILSNGTREIKLVGNWEAPDEQRLVRGSYYDGIVGMNGNRLISLRDGARLTVEFDQDVGA